MGKIVSFMTVDRVEETWAVCEVEKEPMEAKSNKESFYTDCFMTDIDIHAFRRKGLPIFEGNVYSVVHEDGRVIELLKLEETEKQRRVEILRNLGL